MNFCDDEVGVDGGILYNRVGGALVGDLNLLAHVLLLPQPGLDLLEGVAAVLVAAADEHLVVFLDFVLEAAGVF